MQKKIYLFNSLVILYNRSCKKLRRLITANKNMRRQKMLTRRISGLIFKLKTLQKSIRAACISVPLILTAAGEVNAQTFAPEVLNPFSLDTSYVNRPTFADLDNDGDMDMMIGDTLGNTIYYKNSGTASVANFDPPLMNPFGLSATTYFSFPYLADLDNDGDFDILSGDIYGFFYYFQNTGSVTVPSFAAAITTPFSLPLSISDYTTMISMADIDNDGDKDLFAGGFSGNFHYFPNTGTASAPNFGAEILNPFSIAIPGDSLSCPTLGDLDGDGDFDLISGSYYGSFHYYENTGTVSSPTFAAVQIDPFGLVGLYNGLSFPALVDLDGDGDLDLMSGEYDGSFHYFENTSTLQVNSIGSGINQLHVYPNPVANTLIIETGNAVPQKIVVNDILGNVVYSFSPLSSKISVDVSNFKNGIYLVSVFIDGDMRNLKLVKK